MLRALHNLLAPNRTSAPVPALGPDALAQVYQRPEGFYIELSDRTRMVEAGFWVATGAVTVLAPETTDAVLGDADLRALARSRVEVPVPPRDAKLEAGLLRAMGVRSRRAAMAGTRSCLISREPARAASLDGPATPARLRIEALRNGGTRGDDRGYQGCPEQPALDRPLDSGATDFGQAVRATLQHAELPLGKSLKSA
jgi:hypothetical protein